MKWLHCPRCGAPLEEGATTCPDCASTAPTLPDSPVEARRQATELLDQARAHWMEQRLEAARDSLRESLTRDPTLPAASELLQQVERTRQRRRQAAELMGRGETELAEGQFEEAVRLFRQALDLRIEPGVALRKVRQAEQAQEDQHRHRILLSRATAAYQGRQFDQATELSAELLALDPENEAARDLAKRSQEARHQDERLQRFIDEAKGQEVRGRNREAAELYRKLLELDPRETQAQLALAELEQLQSAMGQLDQEQRAEHLATAGFRILDSDPARAAAMAADALKIHPRCTNARLLKSRTERLLQEQSDLLEVSQQAETCYSEGRFEEAIGHWERLIMDGAPDRQQIRRRLQATRALVNRVDEHLPPVRNASGTATPSSIPTVPKAIPREPPPPIPLSPPEPEQPAKRRNPLWPVLFWGVLAAAAILGLVFAYLAIVGEARAQRAPPPATLTSLQRAPYTRA